MSAPSTVQAQTYLTFPSSQAALINPYLPPLDRDNDEQQRAAVTSRERRERGKNEREGEEEKKETRSHHNPAGKKVHLTLTYAHSLDAAISRAPGVRTALSGPESKAMTHYLRTRHDAILVGVGTAVADDPGLNSLVSQPRPVVLDPRGRWLVGAESKVVRLAAEGKGLGPWVFVGEGVVVDEERRQLLERAGGGYVAVPLGRKGRFEWEDVLGALERKGIRSVMVEGGGEVINSLLADDNKAFVDSVIVTIAPTWLGKDGVVVSPSRTEGLGGEPPEQLRLTDVIWCPMGEDVVLCGRIAR
ncbi:hypothetical protein VTH82DRAFT_4416 [Thermothelomyces myriococcoides]